MKKSKKTTKLKLKTVVVKCSNLWQDEIKIDADIFDDIYVEAATRCIEKRKDDPDFKLAVVLECWEKKDVKIPEKHFCYNTYRVMYNAGLYKKAEILRSNFLSIHKFDLRNEPLRGESDDNEPIKPA